MSENLSGAAAVSSVQRLLGQMLSFVTIAFATAALVALLASALGLIPWLQVDARWGTTPIEGFGIWLQVGVAVLALSLILYLPSYARVARLERSHRNFMVSMNDVTRAYRAAHDADRNGVFALSGEFDAMRERMQNLRAHPDLGGLEPELLELAAQMSLQSRDLARIYSTEKVKRARAFLEQRQQEADRLSEQLKVARRTCTELRDWITDVETEERQLNAQFKLLENDLRDILPALGYELEEDGPMPNVVPLSKK